MILQRASAGSGKTFKLAKTYIRLFISTRDEGSDFYRLLSPAEVRDAHSHILAITFTNKATNEMKERIVQKLADLAKPVPAEGMEPADYSFPDYLLSFTGEDPIADPEQDVIYASKGIPARRQEITETCRAALNTLLNNYSAFNISTIDSFFQNVLRTLTYELRLNDSYHVELNDDYLAQMGVDETLNAVKDVNPDKSRRAMADYMSDWLAAVMRQRLETGGTWDAFSKQKKSSIYHELVDMASKMNNENFRKHLDTLDDYFDDPQRFKTFYAGVLKASREVKSLHAEMIKAVKTFIAKVPKEHWNQKGIETKLSEILLLSEYGKLKNEGKKLECNRKGADNTKNKPYSKEAPKEEIPRIQSLFTDICEAYYKWAERRDYWQIILSRLHYLGALYYINVSMETFREQNDIIPLSATNEILHGIIGKDEVPFIYERTGVWLHHFLLDEFQDTSTLQWENLSPLLGQSDSRGFENLIIGDAKQSIYRFRNADPELINSVVKKDFPATTVLPDDLADKAAKAAVNMNWRSSRHIVSFNNSLFKALVPILDKEEKSATGIFSKLYSNVEQAIHRDDEPGYVSIDFASSNSFENIGIVIEDALRRGFAQKDIAILVNTKGEGQNAINSIIRYNKGRQLEAQMVGAVYKPIEFISEESLLVNSSLAVQVVVAVLRMISDDFLDPQKLDPHDKRNKNLRPFELSKLEANFRIGLSTGALKDFKSITTIQQSINADDIRELYQQKGATTLPALIEGIINNFLNEKLITTQAAYLAAFQDVVLEYCETYTSDLSSFLSWWNENGSQFSIAAPDNADAVKIMTIHKSKGLEFDVVIMPKVDWRLGPFKEEKEVIWVSHIPDGIDAEASANAPKIIPITPHSSMNEPASPFYGVYHPYFLECRMDQLNKTYVAFTRAKRELYVYCDVKSGTIGNYMRTALFDAVNADHHNPNLLTGIDCDLDNSHFIYGEPIDRIAEKKKEEEKRARKEAEAKERAKQQGLPDTAQAAQEKPQIINISRYSPAHPMTEVDATFIIEDND
ncbi:MAG: UvrD-helicase domain-containing protein [Muribaculaceae bacterium]|nr:UvrD-helicase domain-containing protein [Muribaculaceae bacterium]